MKRSVKKSVLFFCGVVSFVAASLSIINALGYMKPLKHAIGLP